ncbi:MAG: hypothetical protein ACFB0G_20150 [Leptolyngbyaceae cyanobacterium]
MQLTCRRNADAASLSLITGSNRPRRLTFWERRDRPQPLGLSRHYQLADEMTDRGVCSFQSSSLI